MKRITVFGERPGPNTDAARPLYPHTGNGAAARLIDLMGLTRDQYLYGTLRHNVVDTAWESTTSDRARRKVSYVMNVERELDPEAKFLFVGRQTIQAAPKDYRDMVFGEVRNNVLLIPHTSGKNFFYNDPEATERIRKALRSFISD